MTLENLLKLSISELRRLPISKFSNLSAEDKKYLIETKEQEGSNELFSGIKILSPQEVKDLDDLIDSICPELIERRRKEAEQERIQRKKRKKRFQKWINSETDKSWDEFNAECDSKEKASSHNSIDILTYYDLEGLSSKQQTILEDFQQMNILTSSFQPRDLLEIFQCLDKFKYSYHQSESVYCAEDALADVMNEIEMYYPKLKSYKYFYRIFIVSLSPNFEGKDYILEKGIDIIKKKFGTNPNTMTYITVATDGNLLGSCDMAIRLIMC